MFAFYADSYDGFWVKGKDNSYGGSGAWPIMLSKAYFKGDFLSSTVAVPAANNPFVCPSAGIRARQIMDTMYPGGPYNHKINWTYLRLWGPSGVSLRPPENGNEYIKSSRCTMPSIGILVVDAAANNTTGSAFSNASGFSNAANDSSSSIGRTHLRMTDSTDSGLANRVFTGHRGDNFTGNMLYADGHVADQNRMSIKKSQCDLMTQKTRVADPTDGA
jgi:prepilin-type processing-associated H-X9-DG protein